MEIQDTKTLISRDDRQAKTLKLFIENDFNGGFEAVTGFGKTRVCLNIIKEYLPKSLCVVVPTLILKEAWIKHLKSIKIKGDVLVINTAYKTIAEYDMLVIDEAHKSVSENFIKLFDNLKHNKLIWLTATVERADGRHELLIRKAPIVDTVSLEEALENEWVSPFELIKIPIKLTKEESDKLEDLNEQFLKIKKTLGSNPKKAADIYGKYINLTKWCYGKETGKLYFMETLRNELGDKLDSLFDKYWLKPDKKHPVYLKAVAAIKFWNVIAERKELLYTVKGKLDKTLELIEEYKDQYKFIFSERTLFLDEIAKHLPQGEYAIYHSKKSLKDNQNNFKRFIDGRTKVKTLLSVKSLVEGVDIPKLSINIITSFTSSNIVKMQQWGRVLRKSKDKKAVVIYLYVPNSQEERWLENLKIEI
jgi:superfamily II DNA or RNA helicase